MVDSFPAVLIPTHCRVMTNSKTVNEYYIDEYSSLSVGLGLYADRRRPNRLFGCSTEVSDNKAVFTEASLKS